MSFGDELAAPSAYEEALSSGAPRNASKLPLIVSGLCILSSIAIYVIFPHDAMLFSIIGYLLTPIGGALSLAWGQALDVSGRRDVWYSPSSSLMMVLKIMAVLSFVIGIVHMWNIASIIAASVAP
jgi:hypothetical protein